MIWDKKRRLAVFFAILLVLLICVFAILQGRNKYSNQEAKESSSKKTSLKGIENDIYEWPSFQVDLLEISPYNRPGTSLTKVSGIVVHYTANPGTDADQNRNYFAGLASSHATAASSHFIIGLEGNTLQLIPLSEISYASNDRNNDTISIEICHPDESGKFTKKTYEKAVEMCAWLCLRYQLDVSDVIRHYDVTGKNCPKYFVEHPKAWKQFKKDIASKMEDYPLAKED